MNDKYMKLIPIRSTVKGEREYGHNWMIRRKKVLERTK